jgi:hypothetical protein
VSAALLNIVIGLVTSVLSGAAVWSWQRTTRARLLLRDVTETAFILPGRPLPVPREGPR